MSLNQSTREYDLELNVEKVLLCMFEKGMSKQELSNRLGCNRHTVTHYLRHPEKLTLEQVAEIANICASSPFPEDFIKRVERTKNSL